MHNDERDVRRKEVVWGSNVDEQKVFMWDEDGLRGRQEVF